MQFNRVESVQGDRIFCVFEISREEYAQLIIDQRNEWQAQARQDQIERENEIDRERERQWYENRGPFKTDQNGDYEREWDFLDTEEN